MTRTDTPHPQAITEQMKQKLMKAAASGWDAEPMWGLMVGDSKAPDGVTLAEMVPPTDAWAASGPHPLDHLRQLIFVLSQPTNAAIEAVGRTLRNMVSGKTRGAWFLVEGWAAPETMEAELARRRLAGGSVPDYADIPGSYETKTMILVDSDGTGYAASLSRPNPEAVETAYGPTGEEPGAVVGGAVVDVLSELLRLLSAPVPVEPPAPGRAS